MRWFSTKVNEKSPGFVEKIAFQDGQLSREQKMQIDERCSKARQLGFEMVVRKLSSSGCSDALSDSKSGTFL
jgi:hypothetical protein